MNGFTPISQEEAGYTLLIDGGSILCPKDIMFKGASCKACEHHQGIIERCTTRAVLCGYTGA